MNDQIFTPNHFKWFLTLLTGVVATLWFFYDTTNLIRARKLDRKDAVVRDKHFGYVMGILIGLVGVYGTLRYQGVL